MPTRAPWPAKATAIALPIPELAPVTTLRRPASGCSPACAVNGFSYETLTLGAAGERVTRGRGLGQHLVDARLAIDGGRDRLLHGRVVVVVDLLVVGGVPVDEHADDQAQIVSLILGDDAFGDGVHDRASDRRLSRTEQLRG